MTDQKNDASCQFSEPVGKVHWSDDRVRTACGLPIVGTHHDNPDYLRWTGSAWGLVSCPLCQEANAMPKPILTSTEHPPVSPGQMLTLLILGPEGGHLLVRRALADGTLETLSDGPLTAEQAIGVQAAHDRMIFDAHGGERGAVGDTRILGPKAGFVPTPDPTLKPGGKD